MALFDGLEQFFEGLPRLISQGRRQLHSDNLNIFEHFGRRLQDASDVLNIFKSRCEDILAPTGFPPSIKSDIFIIFSAEHKKA